LDAGRPWGSGVEGGLDAVEPGAGEQRVGGGDGAGAGDVAKERGPVVEGADGVESLDGVSAAGARSELQDAVRRKGQAEDQSCLLTPPRNAIT